MIFNYLVTALLSIRKQPVFAAIKILSLTLGLGCSTLVLLHVQFVQNTNKHIENWDSTYRLVTHMMVRDTNTPYRTFTTADTYLGFLRQDYGDLIEHSAHIRGGNALFGRGTEATENSLHWADPDVVPIFDLEFVQGDAAGALLEPNTMLLTESTAAKYFGNENPIGQVLTYNNQVDIQVIGVVRDVPASATVQFEMLISIPTGRQLFGENFMNGEGWISFSGTQTYLRFRDAASAYQLENDLRNFIDRNMPENSVTFARQNNFGLSLQPLDDIYLNPLDNFGAPENSSTQPVLYGLVVFAVLILVTSCINYVNLSLVQITQRGKEIGVRKTLGAGRAQIISQFLLESLLLTFIALLLAVPIVLLALPVYANFTDISLMRADLFASDFLPMMLALVLLTGVLSGVLPALSLSRMPAINALKSAAKSSRAGKLTKAAVTSVQFTLSAALILLAIAIYLQTRHLQELDVGYNKDNLIIVDSRFNNMERDAFNYSALLNDLRQHPGVVSVASSENRPPSTGGINPWRLPRFEPDESITVAHVGVSPGFIETYQMELLAGRTFSEEYASDFTPDGPIATDVVYNMVITDSLARRFGFATPEDALDQPFSLFDYNFRVIGVIKRFQFSSGMETEARSIGILRSTLRPMRYLHIRVVPQQADAALAHIDEVWARHRPNVPIDRTFFSQTFADIIENRTSGLRIAALMASIITVLIAGFGLYALASYSSLRRTKEVGVRKTLGASTGAIVRLLAWDFVKPVLLACVLAWPLAWFAIDRFYQTFSSQAEFPFIIYVVVTLAVIALALMTVAMQCFRTANTDPVRSLRYE
jgi:putative ABC transport system permease protein